MTVDPFVEQLPAPAEDAFQDGPVGGTYDGQTAHAALFVAPVGVVTVRELPSLMGSSGLLTANGTGQDGQVFPLMSTDPQRRRVWVGGVSGTPRISHNRAVAEAGGGVPVPTGAAAIPLAGAGELYVYFPTKTDALGFYAEIDPS